MARMVRSLILHEIDRNGTQYNWVAKILGGLWACGRSVQAYDVLRLAYQALPWPAMLTFAELFCRAHDVEANDYADAMFWRSLHRRALFVAPFVKLFAPDYFQPDYELIRAVATLTSTQALADALSDFNFHPGNHGWKRRRLKLRVSGRRVTRIVLEHLPSGQNSPTRRSS